MKAPKKSKRTRAIVRRTCKKPCAPALTFSEPVQPFELASTAAALENLQRTLLYTAKCAGGMRNIYSQWAGGIVDPDVPIEENRVAFLRFLRPSLERAQEELSSILKFIPGVSA